MRIKHMSLLARNGIPGPKPSLITGNIFEYRQRPSVETHVRWLRAYGKVMGFYNGHKPTVLVADPELAKNIQIKDFQYFTDRPKYNIKRTHPLFAAMLIRQRGRHWKAMRSVLTPTFSTSKLKTMTPIIDDTIASFMDIVDKHSTDGQEFDIYDMCRRLAADVITRTAFGIQSDVQNGSNEKFFKAIENPFNDNSIDYQWLVYAIQCFPTLNLFVEPFRRVRQLLRQTLEKTSEFIILDTVKDMLRMRRREPNRLRKDFMQLLIDTKISEEEMSRMTDERLIAGSEEKDIKTADNKQNFSLTEEEIEANCVMFYMAGYDTTTTALGFMAHILVSYPEVQERLRQEVRQLYESDDEIDINAINRLEFMECVVKETTRIYPPVITFVSRECLADYKYKDMTIPKGTTVLFSTYHMHNDPDYWPEPEKFDPNRFSPERRHEIHPSSWQPFGSGPRNCIAMRFAIFVIKLTFAKLLMRYRLVPSAKTEMGELSTECKYITLHPKRGVYVKAVKIV